MCYGIVWGMGQLDIIKSQIMLKFDLNTKMFETLEQSDMTTEHIMERYDFQSAIVNSWETVKNNLGLPTSYLIGEEISPHSSVGNSIDLLAFNPDDSSLIVIELKRSKNKLQLLQAISYAAMVATWDNEHLISQIQSRINPEAEELEEAIKNNELNQEVKIILVSELFDPEVIITSEWLSSNYGVDITAFSISLHKLGEQCFVDFHQKLPLLELSDAYEERGRRSKKQRVRKDVQWQDIRPKLQYKFANAALDLCLSEKDGEPSRRQFTRIRTNLDGFKWINLNFRNKYINVYIKGNPDNAEELLLSKFNTKIKVLTWAKGYSINIYSESQFDDLKNWLSLGKMDYV